MNIEITYKTFTIFTLGATAGMILLALSMEYYDDSIVNSETIWQTAAYFVIISIIGYLGMEYESKKHNGRKP